jgi:hypothetical protein
VRDNGRRCLEEPGGVAESTSLCISRAEGRSCRDDPGGEILAKGKGREAATDTAGGVTEAERDGRGLREEPGGEVTNQAAPATG